MTMGRVLRDGGVPYFILPSGSHTHTHRKAEPKLSLALGYLSHNGSLQKKIASKFFVGAGGRKEKRKRKKKMHHNPLAQHATR